MKRLIFIVAVAFSLSAKSQNLDTVLVRNLTLQAQDWAWLVGKYGVPTDSVNLVAFRRIRAKVQQSIPPTWTTNVTIDSLPGKVVVSMYEMTQRADAGEVVNRYTAIKNAISSKVNLSYWIGFIDARVSSEFDRKRDIGKNILIDN
jgi:hypothetical protein